MKKLEILEITSRHLYEDIFQHLFNIFRGCGKLKTIEFEHKMTYLGDDFVNKTLDILKSVRDPSTQVPLEMRISRSGYAVEDKMTAIEKTYLLVTYSVDLTESESEADSDEYSEEDGWRSNYFF